MAEFGDDTASQRMLSRSSLVMDRVELRGYLEDGLQFLAGKDFSIAQLGLGLPDSNGLAHWVHFCNHGYTHSTLGCASPKIIASTLALPA